ncbi:MAG: sulfotransferase [Deltaproteobacteria bacterium CG07_land_8_20_14_0_80_60_11]|nr:MAG: sulfotransferase [Deltaproteobacteria bacterium CG07_land_8_20_14_0_80_60_11]
MPMSQPDRLNRSRLLRLINTAGRRLAKNGFSFLRLDEKALLDRAREQTGLDDFGDDLFQEAMRVLFRAYETEAELSFVGRICVRGDTLRLLSNRLRLVADRRRYPGIADEVIRRPLFITGLPRSGTTFLHALLAQDPAHRAPQVWEVMYPSPPPERASYAANSRITTTARQLKWLDWLMPDFETVHLIDARLPQECIAITSHDFRSYTFESMYTVPSYRAWHDRQDKRPEYEFHRHFLQHLQWRCPGQRWVLKAPSHLLALEGLLQVYPDAGIILTHRDPLKVLASCASFTEVLRSAFTEQVNKAALAREVRQRWEEGAGLAVKYRQAQGDLQQQLFDVHYAELLRAPMSMVRRIYTHFDLELSAAAEMAMERFLLANPKNKGGVHRYSLEEFGLNPAEERRRFQFYLDFFGIEPEG